MALSNVAGFVGDDRCQLIATADHTNQPQIHAHITAGQCKRIDLPVLAQNQRPGKTLFQLWRQLPILARRILQVQPDAFHILLQHRVIEIVRVAVQLLDDGIAQAALLTRSQRGRPIAQRGQTSGLYDGN